MIKECELNVGQAVFESEFPATQNLLINMM